MKQTENPTAKTTPKGGRKGGVLFPKLNLKQALDYSKKVVSKTHTGPQPESTILPGVFGNAGPLGKVRASALKQYGLLEGAVNAYRATKLAIEIEATLDGDRQPLLQRALLSSKLFNQIFETFKGDTVSKAKVEQRAKGLSVHPESAVECAQLFIESAATAGLGTVSGDSISLTKVGPNTPADRASADALRDEIMEDQGDGSEDGRILERREDAKNPKGTGSEQSIKQGVEPGVTLSLTVDPSSDPDKLEKQLKLLRQYGLI